MLRKPKCPLATRKCREKAGRVSARVPSKSKMASLYGIPLLLNKSGVLPGAAALAEEGLEHGGAFILADARGDGAAVVELWVLEEIEEAAAGTIFLGGAAEDDALEADVD